MKLVSVVLVVSISGAVSGHAWPEVNGENAAAKRLVFGALASEVANALTTLRLCVGYNKDRIVDLNYRTAVRLLRPPIASSHHALSPPARALIHYHLAQQLHHAPAGQAAPPGPNWGTPGAPPPPPPVANAPGPAGTSWSPPPGGPPSAAIPRPAQAPQAPPAPAFSAPAPQANPPAPPPPQAQPLAPAPPSAEAQYVGACPGTIKCPGNNVCTPDPKNKSSFLCIQPLEQCAGIQSQQCQGGKTCVADPRIQCKGQACTGLCV
ncbi:hypothetical protein BLS_003885 [Venturia inaequalis]|uniref:Uncharacterized protein n=1 Tax=Venturia inaequalis TaxID=5025 RepID=A0A8H3UQ97_VENIN|nr:hypothetical protein BLS_003885 [Venturia inaequalis]